jgi:hypothetical protein
MANVATKVNRSAMDFIIRFSLGQLVLAVAGP